MAAPEGATGQGSPHLGQRSAACMVLPLPGQPGPGHARDSPWAPWGLWGGGCGSAGRRVTHGSAKGMPASSLPLQAQPCFVGLWVPAGAAEEKGEAGGG